jgi:hypothetical protein
MNQEEPEYIGLTFVDPNDDGHRSASEIDFLNDADKAGEVTGSGFLLGAAKQTRQASSSTTHGGSGPASL